MNNNSLKKLERALFLVFLGLAVVAVVGIMAWIAYGNDTLQNQINQPIEEQEYDWEAGLSDNTLWLPKNCNIYSKVPEFTFSDDQGNQHTISEFEGKPTVVIFWASWCSDCKEQMPNMNLYMDLAKKYADIQFLFINKTDGTKETKESANSYFQNKGIEGINYFDDTLTAYDRLGIHNIPTTLFLDENGIITAWSPKQITEVSKFDALLQKALYGGSYATSHFIITKLMDQEGGVHSTYKKESEGTNMTDILSESQGAMLEYAVLNKNQDLFDQVLNYISIKLWGDGLTPWKVSKGEASKVNALVDDLRIYDAIVKAGELWSGYENIAKEYRNRIFQYGIHKNNYVDFYDAESNEYANRFTLCYGDFKAMKELADGNEDFEAAYNSCREIVKNGQISDEFPLYYSWYNYKSKKYEKDDLNMAEAMVTLLHLAEVDQLPENTVEWLKTQMDHGGLKARLTVEGKVVKGYQYESTAVYALVAMIGVEQGDPTLINQAVSKMEKMRIDDASLDLDGAFGDDESEINSFDQLMPLLAYVKIYGK